MDICDSRDDIYIGVSEFHSYKTTVYVANRKRHDVVLDQDTRVKI